MKGQTPKEIHEDMASPTEKLRKKSELGFLVL